MILVLFLKELCDVVALVVNNLPANARNAGDAGSIPGLERSPGEGNGNPLQYSCLKNSRRRSLARYSPWGRKELGTTGHACPVVGLLGDSGKNKKIWVRQNFRSLPSPFCDTGQITLFI